MAERSGGRKNPQRIKITEEKPSKRRERERNKKRGKGKKKKIEKKTRKSHAVVAAGVEERSVADNALDTFRQLVVLLGLAAGKKATSASKAAVFFLLFFSFPNPTCLFPSGVFRSRL